MDWSGVDWTGLEQNRVNRFQLLYMERMKVFTTTVPYRTVPPLSVANGKIYWDTGVIGSVFSAGVVLYFT